MRPTHAGACDARHGFSAAPSFAVRFAPNRKRSKAPNGRRIGSKSVSTPERVNALKNLRSTVETPAVTIDAHGSDALVLANLPLIGYHVNSVLGRVPAYVSRADLASAGALALVKAARAYDPETGVPFERYAALRIRGALIDELRGMDWLSRGARRRARQVAEVGDELTSHLGRLPTKAELAEALGVDEESVDTARGDADVRLLSIEGFGPEVHDVVVDTAPGPEATLLGNEKLRYLTAGVASLPERLRYIVEELFFHDRPVVELAEELGVTHSRISQLRSEALTLLRDGMNASLEPGLVPQAERPDGVAERRRRAYFAQVAAQAATNARASTAGVVPTQRTATHDAPAYAGTAYAGLGHAAVG